MKISKRLLAWALSLVITASAGIPAAAGEAGLPGDMNRDGRLSAADAVLLRQRILKGGAAGRSLSAGDLDGDGSADDRDLRILLQRLDILEGDVNGDGSVDEKDVNAIRTCMATDTATDEQLAAGDLDGSGAFTVLDAMLLRKLLKEPAPQPGGETGQNAAGVSTYTAVVEDPSDAVSITLMSRDRVVATATDQLTCGPLEYGDTIAIQSDYQYFWVELAEDMGPALLYAEDGSFSFQVPQTGEAYPDGIWGRSSYTVRAWPATDEEVAERRNLALNPYDFIYADEINQYDADTADLVNDSAAMEKGIVETYPHAYANRVTENKNIFQARNAIDGVTETGYNHNDYPYQSWGCGRYDDAEYVVYFGREVTLDALSFVLRADFSGSPPHDTYWESITAEFSDGSTQTFSLEKGGDKQIFEFEPVTTSYVRLKNLVRHEDDNSQMWAALIELEALGTDLTAENPPARRTYLTPGLYGKELQNTTDQYKSAEIADTMKQVYDYFEDNIGVTTVGWKESVYYIGVMDAYMTTGDLDYYLNCRDTAESFAYKVNGGQLTDFGDDYAISQMYLGLDALSPDPDYKLAGTIANADYNVDLGKVEYWWCDALFMSGMVYTELSRRTGDSSYSDTEFASYKEWYDKLYSPEYDLWYRDGSYIGKKTDSGQPIFWSRGNAWVFAYLARQLSYLPDTESEIYQRYLTDYLALAASLKAYQREDGTWNACLNDDQYYGGKETTGTAGYLYGYAVGVQLGLLDAAEYLPVVLQAYDALTGVCMVEPGKIGYMEKEAADPTNYVSEEYSKELMNSFGTGLFLMGASALMRMCQDYEAAYLEVPLDSQDREYSRFHVEEGYYDGPITATASSDDGNKPSGIFDYDVSGAKGTRWSANGMNNWLIGDLGQLVPLYKINLYPLEERDYHYAIDVSDDGQRWVTLVDRMDNTEKAPYFSHTFDPVNVRYVRLRVNGAATYTGGFTSFSEMFLYPYTGEDAVLNIDDIYEDPHKDITFVPTEVTVSYSDDEPAAGYYTGPVTATATDQQTGNEVSNLFNKIWTDAATGSRWSAYRYPQSATADLGKTLPLSQITMMVLNGRQYYYQLEVSENGEDWYTVSIVDDIYETAKNHTFTFAQPVDARYLRLTVSGSNAADYSDIWISINEILLYEQTGDPEDPDDPDEPQPTPPYGELAVESAFSSAAPAKGWYEGAVSVTATDQQEGNEAQNLFNKVWSDDATGSRWAAMRYPQTATADFGQAVDLQDITLLVHAARPYTYRLEASPDGESWQTIAQVAGTAAENHTFHLSEAVPVQYLRLTVTGCDQSNYSEWVGIKEILVYTEGAYEEPVENPDDPYAGLTVESAFTGDEPAAGYYTGPATATATNQQTGNEVSNLFNKVWTNDATGSRWAAYRYPQSATADFGSALQMEKITLMIYNARPYSYRVEASADGENWHTIAAVQGETAGNHTFTFSKAVPVQYLRLTFNGCAQSNYSEWIGVNELLVYEAADTPTPEPTADPYENLTVESAFTGDQPADGYYAGYVKAEATDQQEGNEAANAFDRIWTEKETGTRWAACWYPQAITADFGSAIDLSKITLMIYKSRPYVYTLEVSPDGDTWHTLAEPAGEAASNHTFTLSNPVPVRYLRVTFTGCDQSDYSDWAGVNEILVYMGGDYTDPYADLQVTGSFTDDAPADGYYIGPVSATATNQEKGNEVQNLFNGIWTEDATGSRWAAYKYPNDAVVDLGDLMGLDQITLLIYKSRPYQYTLEISDDGGHWHTVARVDGETAGNHTFAFDSPVGIRYIRLVFTGCAESNYSDWIGVNEMLLYPADAWEKTQTLRLSERKG